MKTFSNKRTAMLIDLSINPDYSQAQKMAVPQQVVVEKVLAVKEPRKIEKSSQGRLEPENRQRDKDSRKKRKGLSIFV